MQTTTWLAVFIPLVLGILSLNNPSEKKPATRLLTRREAATYLAISPRKLDQLVAEGDLPRVKIGSCVRFERADLDAFITAQKSA